MSTFHIHMILSTHTHTHTSLDRADVKDRIQHWLEDEANAVPDFTFEAEDHITLYYACGQIQRISIDLKCYRK